MKEQSRGVTKSPDTPSFLRVSASPCCIFFVVPRFISMPPRDAHAVRGAPVMLEALRAIEPERQEDAEGGAATELALDVNRAAVHEDQAPRDREPEPRPAL